MFLVPRSDERQEAWNKKVKEARKAQQKARSAKAKAKAMLLIISQTKTWSSLCISTLLTGTLALRSQAEEAKDDAEAASKHKEKIMNASPDKEWKV